MLPMQQPLQLPGPHVGGAHAPPLHVRGCGHETQAWPPMPHWNCPCCASGTHCEPEQHPLGQLSELQALEVQRPPVHVVPPRQMPHAWPNAPHWPVLWNWVGMHELP